MTYADEDSGSREEDPQADSGGIGPDSGDETGRASADLPAFLTEDETAALDA